MDADEDCQSVEWWERTGFYARPSDAPPVPRTIETSGIYSMLEPGEIGIFWPDGSVVRIRSKGH